MKRAYERPLMSVELFMANQGVASSCTTEGGLEWKFDCMYGTDVDTLNNVVSDVLAAGCTTKVGYAGGITTARDYDIGFGHSNNNPSIAEWTNGSDNGGQYLQVTYSGAQGILYTDGDGNGNIDLSPWTVETVYVKHSNQGGRMHHMVSPVIDTTSVSASW